MSNLSFWLATKLLLSHDKKVISTTGWISMAGLVIGVASLFVSMAVISGFETTLMNSVTDVAGHLQVMKNQGDTEPWENLFEKIKKLEPSVQAGVRYLSYQGVLAHDGRVKGIVIHGVDNEKLNLFDGLRRRIKDGAFQMTTDGETPLVLIGKGIAQDFSLKVGDVFKIVVPLTTEIESTQFQRRLGSFKVAGILDLGKYEFDQRWVFATLSAAQKLADKGSRYGGLQLFLNQPQEARNVGVRLVHQLGQDYRIRDWKDFNENIFEAVKIEKVVIFFVIFIIVIAAAFNVASALYVNVVRSFSEIAILKALGLNQKSLIRLFSIQGILMGSIGCILGLLLGLIFCFGFMFLQNQFGIIQGGVYKIDHIDIQIRFSDVMAIVFATLGICFLATLAPARKGASLTTIEGLRNE